VYRICHEKRLGFENTIFFLSQLEAPQVVNAEEVLADLEDEYNAFRNMMVQGGFKNEIDSFITLGYWDIGCLLS
jgi:hypothetical protein